MTLSEALIEMKNNKVIKRANCNTTYCFDSNVKKFGLMIKYNQHEGVKYDIKYSEQDTLRLNAEDFLADDWVVAQGGWRSGSAIRLHRMGRGFESLTAHWGKLAEWSNAIVLKTIDVKSIREFESLTFLFRLKL